MTNQEINELVAKKLGYSKDFDFGWIIPERHKDGFVVGQTTLPDFCTSIEAAWEIVDWIKKQKPSAPFRINFEIKEWGDGYLAEVFGEEAEVADTAPMAICLAFLKLSEGRL